MLSNKNRTKKKNPAARFFKIVILTVLSFIVLSFIGVYAYSRATYTPEKGYTNPPSMSQVIENMFSDDININVLVCGVDKEETRTDVIFIANFDSESGEIKLMSVPRDTYTEITPEVSKMIKNEGRSIPSAVKINAVHAYAGKEIGMECLALQLEDLLDIEIDNYVLFNIEAFKAVVDIIDGVEMYVPCDMYYTDPEQDLYINVKEGLQVLDGETAEQVVRNRQYVNGDLGRIDVQHQFLSAFMKKVLNTDTIVSNAPELVKAAFKYIKTDMSISDMLGYIKYVDDVTSSELHMETVPGYAEYIDGVSYYIANTSSLGQAVDKIFYSGSEYQGTSKHKRIEVSNGGEITGLAGRTRDVLEEEGFTVSDVTTYRGEQTDYTRIIVKEEGMGQDLLPYFDNAVIIVDDLLLGGNDDILIILGLDQGEITALEDMGE